MALSEVALLHMEFFFLPRYLSSAVKGLSVSGWLAEWLVGWMVGRMECWLVGWSVGWCFAEL